MEKPHISATQLAMFCRCAEQYRRRYVCGERIPPGIALVIGRGYHSGAEFNFRQKIESREDLAAREIADKAVAEFDATIDRDGLLLTPEEKAQGAKVAVGRARDKVVALSRAYREQQAPDYQPVGVEVSTRIAFPAASHDLLCITDLRDDQDRVTDLKTAARAKPQNAAEVSLQLSVEAAAFVADTGRMPTELRLDTITKGEKPKRQVLATQRSRADFGVLAARVNAILRALAALTQSGEGWPPADLKSWWCATKWCGYARTCAFFNPEREVS